MNADQQKRFGRLVEQERILRGRRHELHDTQIVGADMLYIFLEIPRWKVWSWYPILRHLFLMQKIHHRCCRFKVDDN